MKMKKFLFVFVMVLAVSLFAVVANADNSNSSQRLSLQTVGAIVDKVIELKNTGSSRDQIVTSVFNLYGNTNTSVSTQDDDRDDNDDDEDANDNGSGKPEWAGKKSKSSIAKTNLGQVKKMLRHGDNSEEVKALQEALNKIAGDNGLVFNVLIIDGKYGTNTVKLVKMLQAYKGIQADGVVGPVTLAKLIELLDQADTSTVNQKPVITLNGSSSITVTQGATFTDPGATATDTEDGNLTSNITKTGSVNTAVLGNYVLAYNVVDSKGLAATQVTRTVSVVANQVPVINLLGNATMTLSVGTAYTEPGATVTDPEGEVLSATITGSVNTALAGTYVLSYNATDSLGAIATQVTRTVIVVTP